MKITICGSTTFIEDIKTAMSELVALGHEVKIPPTTAPGEDGKPIPIAEYYKIKKLALENKKHWIWKDHDSVIRMHLDKIGWCDAILVFNKDKNNIAGYIGPNTLIEMGLAFYLHKPIFLMQDIPTLQYTEEIRGLKPVVLKGTWKNLVL